MTDKYKITATMTKVVTTEMIDAGTVDLKDQAHEALLFDYGEGDDEEFSDIEITKID